MFYKTYIKPIADFLIAGVCFIMFSPVFIFLSFLLFIVNQGSPYFLQARPGKNGKIFRVIKFKTMNDKRNSQGVLLSDSERLTRIGSFVRKTSLDEMPQLLNVIKGEMSLVGPRPLLIEYLPLYNNLQMRRHDVKPGITGWAQINGRNAISWEQKFEYDIWYVDHLSLQLDCQILMKTILKVFKSEGVNQNRHVTMPKFGGSMNGVPHRS